jgi:hypothetical protein
MLLFTLFRKKHAKNDGILERKHAKNDGHL